MRKLQYNGRIISMLLMVVTGAFSTMTIACKSHTGNLYKNSKTANVPKGKPVKRGWVSARFGTALDPVTGASRQHNGIDFAAKKGTPVYAVASGIVIKSKRSWKLGKIVEIDHGNGYITRYAHNSKNMVRKGQRVNKGQHIANVGSTGRSSGSVLHYEILKNGKHINPKNYL